MKALQLFLLLVAGCLTTNISQAEDSTSVLLIVEARLKPDSEPLAAEYQVAFMPLAKAAGGKPVARYASLSALCGEAPPNYIAVMSFPSADAVRGLFGSAESKALDLLRQRLFEKVNIWISPQEQP